MALIKCPECQSEISDQALTCPRCGFPLKKGASSESDANKIVEKKIQTIQLTGKKWKMMKLIFVPMFILGSFLYVPNLFVSLLSEGESSTEGLTLYGILFFIGLIGTIIASFGSWWDHR